MNKIQICMDISSRYIIVYIYIYIVDILYAYLIYISRRNKDTINNNIQISRRNIVNKNNNKTKKRKWLIIIILTQMN